jgi:8-oxo-dGTP diphosphatase
MAHTDKFTVVPAAYVVLRRGDEVLLVRRANTGYMDGWYGLPSGHIDGGEPAHLAAVREAKEEVGITIKPADLHFIHVTHRLAESRDHERVDFGFMTTRWQGVPHNAEPEKCDDIRWCRLDNLPKKTVPTVRDILAGLSTDTYYSYLNFG